MDGKNQEVGTQAQEQAQEAVWINVPAHIGTSKKDGNPIPSVKPFEFVDNSGKQQKMASVTLPPGTMMGEKDLSFYQFAVPEYRLNPGGKKFAEVESVLQMPDKDGAWHDIRLKRDFGHKGDDGSWVGDVDNVTISPQDLKAALDERYRAYKLSRDAAKEPGNPQGSFAQKREEAQIRSQGNVDPSVDAPQRSLAGDAR